MAANSYFIMVNSAFFCLLLFSFSEATGDHHHRHGAGFSTSLFHRDSPLSPLHDPSLSQYDRLKNAFSRSFSRSQSLFNRAAAAAAASPESVQSPITSDGGEFVMDVSIGTPPVEFIAIADTGSDLTWTQCLPCRKCLNQSRPIFNPQRSSSYLRVPCTSDDCHAIDRSICGFNQRTCDYTYSYGDQSYTKGELGYEKITLGSSNGRPFVLRNTVVGCGHENGGSFGTGSGIIGLGGGSLSLVSQLKKTSAVSRRFSYCLPNVFSEAKLSSKINFGWDAVVSGRGVVSTPFIPKFPETFYYLTLEAISVGNKRHEHKPAANVSAAGQRGNIIIDSGTTLTYLPQNLYSDVVSTLAGVIRAKRVRDPTGFLELCYAADDIADLNIPIITAHFTGADVNLLPLNTFGMVADHVTCLTFSSSSSLAIFGNLAQMNFLVGYDLERRILSFKPTICAQVSGPRVVTNL